MKRKSLSFILSLACALGLCVGAGATRTAISASAETATVTDSAEKEFVDYAGQATLHFNSNTKTIETTVKTFIDGDTTHFNVSGWGDDDTFKARYAAVNTPESTGKLEEWGKAASKYTRNALENAESIVIESDGDDWEADSTGDRYLTWVWYKAPGSDTYRNLNLELLQQGLAVGSKASDSRYGQLATDAIAQATEFKLHMHSGEPDPDFFYGESIEVDLKELRLNIESYRDKRVAFEATVAYYNNQGVYVEDYDEETQMYYGIYVYYGFFLTSQGTSVLSIGNRVRVSGSVQYWESGDSYQISDLKYNQFRPGADDIQVIETGKQAANVETSAATFTSKVDVDLEVTDPDTEETTTTTKRFDYAELALNTSISMKQLLVKDAYTTQSGDSKGAMTLTCKLDGKTITVRTIVLKDAAGNMITQDQLLNKVIDVTGVVDCFNGEYQIKILHLAGIKVDGKVLEGIAPEKPDDSSSSDTTSSSSSSASSSSNSSSDSNAISFAGCGSFVTVSAALPVLLAAVVLIKKRENQ